jgi:hypothetical protein
MRPTNVKGDQGMSEDQMDQVERADEDAFRADQVEAHQMGQVDQVDQMDRNDEDDDDVEAHQMDQVDAMDQMDRAAAPDQMDQRD